MEIYVDGACSGNPGPGGWAVYINNKDVITGSAPHTTSNRMELLAVINAHKEVYKRGLNDVSIFTDSEYVYNGMKRVEQWKEASWKNGKIKNIDLWEMFLEVTKNQKCNINMVLIRGHSNIFGNDRADFFAKQSIIK